jgi:hypothetical protein
MFLCGGRSITSPPVAPQSAIQYRANVQRVRFGRQISLDSLLLVITLCSATGKVGLGSRGRNTIWWVLARGICTLAYVPSCHIRESVYV